jgi:hypothetical protein
MERTDRDDQLLELSAGACLRFTRLGTTRREFAGAGAG